MFKKIVNLECENNNIPKYKCLLDFENNILIRIKDGVSYKDAGEFQEKYTKAIKEKKVFLVSSNITIEKIFNNKE